MDNNQTREQQQVNPAWLAAEKYQGSIIINDPAWRYAFPFLSKTRFRPNLQYQINRNDNR